MGLSIIKAEVMLLAFGFFETEEQEKHIKTNIIPRYFSLKFIVYYKSLFSLFLQTIIFSLILTYVQQWRSIVL